MPASAAASTRRSTLGRLSFCTMRTLCSSRGMSMPVKNLMFAIVFRSFFIFKEPFGGGSPV